MENCIPWSQQRAQRVCKNPYCSMPVLTQGVCVCVCVRWRLHGSKKTLHMNIFKWSQSAGLKSYLCDVANYSPFCVSFPGL